MKSLLLISLCLVAASSGLADSDGIPETNLRQVREACADGCSKPGVDFGRCQTYCSCFTDQIKERLTFLELEEASVSIRDGTPPIPPKIKTKLEAAVQACVKQGTN